MFTIDVNQLDSHLLAAMKPVAETFVQKHGMTSRTELARLLGAVRCQERERLGLFVRAVHLRDVTRTEEFGYLNPIDTALAYAQTERLKSESEEWFIARLTELLVLVCQDERKSSERWSQGVHVLRKRAAEVADALVGLAEDFDTFDRGNEASTGARLHEMAKVLRLASGPSDPPEPSGGNVSLENVRIEGGEDGGVVVVEAGHGPKGSSITIKGGTIKGGNAL